MGANKSRCSPLGTSPFTSLLRHSGVDSFALVFLGRTCTVSCWLYWVDWLDMFETDRKGERVSTAEDWGCRRAAGAFSFGLFTVDLGLFADLELAVDLGVVDVLGLLLVDADLGLVVAGTGDRSLDGVRGVRGPLGVGGSCLIK